MKTSSKIKSTNILRIVAFVIVASSCSTPSYLPTVSDNLVKNDQQKKYVYSDLTQLLRSISDVRVDGINENARVFVRRNIQYSAPHSEDTPLFVVDGMLFGNDYVSVYHTVEAKDVRQVQVLIDAEAQATYGLSAQHGAVVIYTSRGK